MWAPLFGDNRDLQMVIPLLAIFPAATRRNSRDNWIEDMKSDHAPKLTVEQVTGLLSAELDELVKESVHAGYQHVERLLREWQSGANRFDGDGEAFFVARIDGQIVGVCGLNVDPFAEGNEAGRVRRLYVSERHRRSGIATALLERVCAEARKTFRVLRVGVGLSGEGVFYESLGFVPVAGVERCTHVLELSQDTAAQQVAGVSS